MVSVDYPHMRQCCLQIPWATTTRFTDDEKQMLNESESEEEEEEDQREHDKEEEKGNGSEKIEDELINLWKEISAKKEEVINKWYGAIYEVSPSKKEKYLKLFVGKATRRFLADADRPATSLETDSLEPPIGETCVLKSVPENCPGDMGIFPIQNIIAQVEVMPLKGSY